MKSTFKSVVVLNICIILIKYMQAAINNNKVLLSIQAVIQWLSHVLIVRQANVALTKIQNSIQKHQTNLEQSFSISQIESNKLIATLSTCQIAIIFIIGLKGDINFFLNRNK